MAFDAADIDVDMDYDPSVGGQRRTLVEQYYHTLDWTKRRDTLKFLAVVEGVIADLDALAASEPRNAQYAAGQRQVILASLKRDGWEFDGNGFSSSADAEHLENITDVVAKIDAPELYRQVERMRASIETDPPLTLGTAKELVESACKTILEERNQAYDAEWDLVRLVKETREALALLPDDIPNSARGVESIRKLLGNLGAVVQALGEIRNLYGTGHGKGGKSKAIQSRHAKLAAGAAATLATFLLETHWERSA